MHLAPSIVHTEAIPPQSIPHGSRPKVSRMSRRPSPTTIIACLAMGIAMLVSGCGESTVTPGRGGQVHEVEGDVGAPNQKEVREEFAKLKQQAAGEAHEVEVEGLLTGEDGQFRVRPAVVGLSGDGTGFLGGFDGHGESHPGHVNLHPGHMTWLTWTSHAATGSGALWVDDGIPNEAEGTFSAVPVKVRAFAPHDGHFTRLTLRYEKDGAKFTDEREVRPVAGGNYGFFILREVEEPA
jgi:hypothetical protein